ncbi:MAG: hypothetical protein AABZ67_16155 [Pseudomonadota bacterium]
MMHGIRASALRTLPALAAALLIAGCASTPQASRELDAEAKQFTSHPNASTVYIYRDDFGGPFVEDSVLYVNGRLIGATLPKTFFRLNLRPGNQVLNGMGVDSGRLAISTRPGEIYFVSLKVLGDQSHFEVVSPERGRKTLAACCALLENWAPGQRPLLR